MLFIAYQSKVFRWLAAGEHWEGIRYGIKKTSDNDNNIGHNNKITISLRGQGS